MVFNLCYLCLFNHSKLIIREFWDPVVCLLYEYSFLGENENVISLFFVFGPFYFQFSIKKICFSEIIYHPHPE